MSNRKQAERKLAKTRTRAQIEKELQEEKASRQAEYSKKVNALLAEGNCGLVTVVQLGGAGFSLDKVLALPHQIIVVAN